MKDKPLVSIIIPCYNYGKYIKDAIDSIKNQTYENYECFIIDDDSTDNSADIIKKEIEGFDKFYYIHQKNGGLGNVRNNGIKMSKGKYYICVDADDVIFPNYIENGVDYMEKHNECVMYYGNAYFWFSDEIPERKIFWDIKVPDKYILFLFSNWIYSTAMIRRSDYNRVGGYDETMKGYEDWEFNIRLLYNHFHIYKDSNTDALLYRRHGKSMDSDSLKKINDYKIYIYNKNKDIYNEYGIIMK